MVEQTWEELGYKIRGIGHRVFVRAEAPPEKTEGGIFYDPAQVDFYAGPMHLRIVSGVILSVGRRAKGLEPGDRVCFQRKYFVKHKELSDRSIVGCINIGEITGKISPEIRVNRAIAMPGGPRQVQELPV